MMTSVGCRMVPLSTADFFFVAAAAAAVADVHEGAAVDVVLVATNIAAVAVALNCTVNAAVSAAKSVAVQSKPRNLQSWL